MMDFVIVILGVMILHYIDITGEALEKSNRELKKQLDELERLLKK